MHVLEYKGGLLSDRHKSALLISRVNFIIICIITEYWSTLFWPINFYSRYLLSFGAILLTKCAPELFVFLEVILSNTFRCWLESFFKMNPWKYWSRFFNFNIRCLLINTVLLFCNYWLSNCNLDGCLAELCYIIACETTSKISKKPNIHIRFYSSFF